MLRLLYFLALFVSATANANLIEDLRSGSSLIIMRHADPPDLATLQAIASMIALLNVISVMMGASKRQRLVSG
jgi:hypothetical protein